MCTTTYIVVFNTKAQDKGDSLKFPFDKMKLNFAIPDLPAFKALGSEASKLLRPSTPEALSVLIPQFGANNQVVLPKSLALEISPYYLLHLNSKTPISLSSYLKNNFWQSFRISIGTSVDSTIKEPNASKLGIGVRFSLIDKGDLKNDFDYLIEEAKKLEGIATFNGYKKLYARENNIANIDSLIKKDSSISKKVKEFVKLKYGLEIFTNQELFNSILKLKESYKKKYWNASKLDMAFAYVGRSPDNFVSNIKYNKFSSWITGASPCKDWGQILYGLNISNGSAYNGIEKKDKNFWEWSLSSRLYIGTNELKGFLETQYTSKGFDNSNNYFIDLGGETILGNGKWLHFYVGYQFGDTINQVISSLDFRFTLPEKNN